MLEQILQVSAACLLAGFCIWWAIDAYRSQRNNR